MKKMMFAIALTIMVSGCGNGWEVTKKSFKSNYGDLPRKVKVYDSLSHEILWEYTGDIYLTNDSAPGNLTLIYKDSNGEVRKNDFIGQHIGISMIELPH